MLAAEQGSAGAPARVLIISHDVVGSRMAGPGIRYWEMARMLAPRQPVQLVAPRTVDLQPSSFSVDSYAWGDASSLATFLQRADVVVANGYALQAHPELAHITQPLAVDLYDPTPLENLELFRDQPDEQRSVRRRQDVQLLARQLAAGDYFLCATERQRDLYIGALMAAGRITPAHADADPSLRRLIDVAPFGLPATPPAKQRAVLRGVVAGIGDDDLVLLWSGGLWDWLDPLALVQAMPRVIAGQPRTRLVFLAGQHPGNVPAMRAPREARARAAALDLLDRHIFFYDQWVPYDERGDFLLEADIAVSLHPNRLESAYAAVRSRFLDHLWAGLPSVVSDGDAAAELARRHQLGRVVAPGDVDGVAAALLDLLGDERERQACGARARQLAATLTWDRCLLPLARWCAAGGHKDREAVAAREDAQMNPNEMAPGTSSQAQADQDADARRNAALAELDQRWHVAEPRFTGGRLAPLRRFFVQQFVRPFVVPILERQNSFNAAVTKAFYALAESADQRRSVTQEQLATQAEQIDALEATVREANRQITALKQHLLDLDDTDTTLAELMLVERRVVQEAVGEAP